MRLIGASETTNDIRIQMLVHCKHLHTYYSRFIPEGVAEESQIFLRDAQVLPKLFSYE
jgi:hypothetical protein